MNVNQDTLRHASAFRSLEMAILLDAIVNVDIGGVWNIDTNQLARFESARIMLEALLKQSQSAIDADRKPEFQRIDEVA